jgi:AraC-like DNA-binding protein
MNMPLLPQVAISFVRILYQFWLQQGISKQVLDDVLRIDINDQKSARFGISSNSLALLHSAVNKVTNDRVLAVRLGQYIAKKNLDLEHMITYSDNLYHGLSAMAEHSKVIAESGYFTLLVQDNGRHALKFIVHDEINFSSQQQDMVFSIILTWIEKLSADSDEYVYYHFDKKIAGFSEYKSLLNCNLVTDDEVYIEIDVRLLAADNMNKNSKLFGKSINKAEKIIIKRQRRLDLYTQVAECIEESLLAGNAQQDVVAEQLDISVRNLQRRLKEVGTSYQAILDDSREALALKLISYDELPLYEVAYKVGFSEPSAFYKAFRRWTGKRPGDYRQDVIQSQIVKRNDACKASAALSVVE